MSFFLTIGNPCRCEATGAESETARFSERRVSVLDEGFPILQVYADSASPNSRSNVPYAPCP